MYTDILVRFGELSTKGKNKMTFVRKLEKNIKSLVGVESRVEFDRIFLDYSPKVMEDLQYIFGIQSYSPVVKTETSLESIEKTITELLKDEGEHTFKVVVKRHWKDFPSSSGELNMHFGGMVIKQKGWKVDVKKPEMKVEIEIRKDFTYVFVKRTNGLGGYPAGINGKVLHLMSGGIDSPVAALELIKRGLHVDFLNFITPPHTDVKTIDKVNRLVKLIARYQGKATIYRSTYTDLMNLIGLTSKQSYKITLMRRSFYRIANVIAKKNNYLGISNGDNLGQVASQTMESMLVIQEQSELPIYRPILTADKIETINKGIKIGTYEISIEKAEEACEIFAPKAPVIKPSVSEAKKLEDELGTIAEFETKNIEEQIERVYIDESVKVPA